MAKLTPTKPKSNAGRPTKYKAEFAEQAYKYCWWCFKKYAETKQVEF